MTARLRRRPSSPAAGSLKDDDLLAEILLRLPPLPSSLPRASAVSKRWRSLASDPRFCSPFRIHHHRNPPLLGCFITVYPHARFQPALEAPNRVPQCRFPFPIIKGHSFVPIGCRHGLVLSRDSRNHFLVWDPVVGDQHLLDIPPGLDEKSSINAAVLRAAGDVRYFEVVLVGTHDMQQAFANVYSSKTGLWGNLTTAPLWPEYITWVHLKMPAVMVGDSLYWFVVGNHFGILEFDLGKRSLGLIPMPEHETLKYTWNMLQLGNMLLIMAEGGGLGLLSLSGFSVQLWKRKTNCDGVASWVMGRSIALDKLLSINSVESQRPSILGFAEGNKLVLLWTSIGIFTVQLESLQLKKLFESESQYRYFPFEGVYTADKGIGGGHDGAELLQNA